eukprot:SAG31_NODE_742_length_12424_cov_16.082353_9_plen_49_part_00
MRRGIKVDDCISERINLFEGVAAVGGTPNNNKTWPDAIELVLWALHPT